MASEITLNNWRVTRGLSDLKPQKIVCATCEKEKDRDDFFKKPSNKTGRSKDCIDCERVKKRNRDKQRAEDKQQFFAH